MEETQIMNKTISTKIMNKTIAIDTDEITNEKNFNADIQQLMNIIVNSFYSQNEIFLRELVSNASDALDKARIDAIHDDSILKIKIFINKEEKTLTIEDNGIGFTHEDLNNNLGTIAHSGTKDFMQKLKSSDSSNMIGQFGVGFYSAFLVADKVNVYTKHKNDKEYLWKSNGIKGYTINTSNIGLKRGTKIVLHIKKSQEEYLDENKLKSILTKHSEFISYPIELLFHKTRTKEVVEVEEDDDDIKVDDVKVEDDDVKVDDVKVDDVKVENDDVKVEDVTNKKKKTQQITENYEEWEQINKKPIWRKKDATKTEYEEFYKTISKDWEEPLNYITFSLEGSVQAKGILYIPKKAPSDLFQKETKSSRIKLYVKKVFVSDQCYNILPDYLNFITGVVDSVDLPLNVSREILQQEKSLKIIRKTLLKKVLELIEKIPDKEYEENFYKHFSKNIKLAVYENNNKYKNRFAKLLRYYSSRSTDTLINLDDYVKNMKKEQPGIYYISGDNKDICQNSPFVEKLKKRGWEVLYFTEPLDEYLLQSFTEYETKKLICCTKEGADFGDSKEEQELLKQNEKTFEKTLKKIKEVLGDKIEKCKITNRLTDSPSIISTVDYSYTSRMQNIVNAQALANSTSQNFMTAKKVLEINPNHKLILTLKNKINKNDKSINDIIWLLFESTSLNSGFQLTNPNSFYKRIINIMALGLGCDDDDDDDDDEKLEDDTEEIDLTD